ncbi:MAG: hypothetical protein M3Y91_10300, partial [Actinomycetota bacterium]|nr:hypothetical protein [Actinomycetota bacterium]
PTTVGTIDEVLPSADLEPPAGKARTSRLSRFRRRRSEATPLTAETIRWSALAPAFADEGGPDLGTRSDAGPATGPIDTLLAQDPGDQAGPIDVWEPDDAAWAGFAVDDTPPVAAAGRGPDIPASSSGVDLPSHGDAAGSSSHPGPFEPGGVALDDEELFPMTATVGWSPDEGDRSAGDDPRPSPPRWRQLGDSLSPRMLAVATAGVLAAGIIGAIVVHPKGFPRFETVNVQGAKGPSLFPGSTADPSTVPPNSTPLIILPPGNTVSSPLPGASSPLPPASPSNPSIPSDSSSPSSVYRGSPPATSGHTPTASGGYSGSPGASPPPASPPPSSNATTTTTRPRPTTTTTAPPTTPPPASPPTTFCILFICN